MAVTFPETRSFREGDPLFSLCLPLLPYSFKFSAVAISLVNLSTKALLLLPQ